MSETPHDDAHIPEEGVPTNDEVARTEQLETTPLPPAAPTAPTTPVPSAEVTSSGTEPVPSATEPVSPSAEQAPPVVPAQPAPPAQPVAPAQPAAFTPPVPPTPRYGEFAPPATPVSPAAQQQPAPGAYPVGSSFGPAAVPPHDETPHRDPAAAHSNRRRSATVGIVAALAVGAVIGGAAGAGVALASGNSNRSSVSSSSVNPTTITVNDPGNATAVTAVAAKASPSVVTINVSASSESGTGSGVILNTSGDILTNTHVVTLDGASSSGSIKVTLNDGRIFTGKVVGTDPISDLAVVKISGASDLQAATFADSTKLNVGDTAVAIGAPLGLSGTVTEGIISALNRSISIASSAVPDDSSDGSGSDSTSPFNFNFPGQGNTSTQSTGTIALSVIQTDAAINPGNSGGALLDSSGAVIGINVAIASTSDSTDSSSQSGSIGVGFAIPAGTAQRVANEIMANGTATHGMLGAGVSDSSTDSDVAGATVASVVSGSPAAKGGIKSGDVITKFNGLPITDQTDLIAEVRAQAAGTKVTITYVRNGTAYDADVTLGKYTS